jgi:hypothetical protein
MNSDELRDLTESYYQDVYSEENIDEVKGFGGRVDPHSGEWDEKAKPSPSQQRFSQFGRRVVRKDGSLRHTGETAPVDTRRSKRIRGVGSSSVVTTADNYRLHAKYGGEGKYAKNPGLAMTPAARMKSRAAALEKRGEGKRANKIKSVLNRPNMEESYDLYDVVLDHLLSEGYADDARSAEVIMTHMSDEWLGGILDEAKIDKVVDKDLKSRLIDPVARMATKMDNRANRNRSRLSPRTRLSAKLTDLHRRNQDEEDYPVSGSRRGLESPTNY